MAVSAIAGIASAVGSALAATSGTFFANLFSMAAAKAFAIGAGLSMVSRALAPKPNIGAQMRGITATTREPAGSRKLIYGKMRVGGQVVFIAHSGDDNKYLNLAIVFASHYITAYDEIWFNDKQIWTASGGFQDDWDDYVTMDITNLGTSTQDASDLLTPLSQWTASHKLRGMAYIAFRLEWDADRFPQGVPNITAVIRGKRVFDPRSGVTGYSANPALCLRDYMLDQSYGLGESNLNIDSTALEAAADLCDEQVGLSSGAVAAASINSGTTYEIVEIGTTDFTAIGASANTVGVQFTATGAGTGTGRATPTFQNRYECHGVIDTANQIKANIEQLLASMGGKLTYSGGKYFVDGAEYKTPTHTFTEADCIGDVQTQTKQSRRGIYNGVKGIFVSAEKNYKVLDYPPQISSTYATEDGDPLYLDMALPFVTNNIQAQRLAKIALLKSRQQVVLTMAVNLKGLQVKVGDTIQVTNDRLNYDQKVFEVIDYSLILGDGGALGVNLTCIETAAALYDWTTSDEEDFLSGGELDLYDGRTVDNVTNLALTEIGLRGPDGGVSSAVELEWTPVTDAFVELYKIRYNKTSTTDYFYASTREPRIYISGLDVTSNYDFRVQAENLIGVKSTGTSLLNQSLNGDQTAPAVPTSLATTGGIRTITATWNNPDDIDLKQIEVHVVSSNSTPASGATPEAVITGEEYVYPTGQAAAITKYFFLRAVDFSGNKSAYTSGVAGTSLQVTSEDVGDGEIEGRTLALLLNQDASGNANAGEGALVGVNVDGTVNMNADGSVLYNGTNVTIEHDQYSNFTFLTQVAGKRGYIAFDLNKTAPFNMGSRGNFDCAFVWSENDQFYYDVNNTTGSGATETAFDPSSFTGTTTGTDVNDGSSTTTAHIVALGTLETTSGGDNILSGGLFPEPLDISTTQIPDDVITGRTIVVNSITANKISGDISEVFNLGAFIYPSHTVPEGITNKDVATTFTVPAPDSDLKKYASLVGRIKISTTTTVNTCILQTQFQRKSKGTTSGTDIGTLVGSGSIATNFHYLEVSGNKTNLVDTFGGLSTSQTSPSITVKPAAVEYRSDTDRTRIIYGFTSTSPAFTSGTIYYNADRWLSTSNWLEDASGTQDFIIPALTTNDRTRTLTLNQALANSDALEEYRMRVNTEDKSAGTVKIISIQSQIILNT